MDIFSKNCLATGDETPAVTRLSYTILLSLTTNKDIFWVNIFMAWFKPPLSIIVDAHLKILPAPRN